MGKGLSHQQLASLRAIPLFEALSDKELAEIDRLVDEIEVPAGETLIREGSSGAHESFVVVSGEADVLIGGKVVAALGPGAFFGEMALIDHRPRSATIIAKTDMRLLIVGPEAFGEFLAQPAVAKAALRGLVSRLRTADEQGG